MNLQSKNDHLLIDICFKPAFPKFLSFLKYVDDFDLKNGIAKSLGITFIENEFEKCFNLESFYEDVLTLTRSSIFIR